MPRGRATTRDHVVVHVDATPLLSGELRAGDRCEIPGVGPVPATHARSLLGGGDSTPDNLRGMRRQHHRRTTDRWIPTDLADGSCTLEPPPGSADTVAA